MSVLGRMEVASTSVLTRLGATAVSVAVALCCTPINMTAKKVRFYITLPIILVFEALISHKLDKIKHFKAPYSFWSHTDAEMNVFFVKGCFVIAPMLPWVHKKIHFLLLFVNSLNLKLQLSLNTMFVFFIKKQKKILVQIKVIIVNEN